VAIDKAQTAQRPAGRLGLGELVAGASGLAMLILMFIPWFAWATPIKITPSAGDGYSAGGVWTAWQAFPLTCYVLLLAALAGLALAGLRALRPVGLPVVAGLAVAALGAMAVLVILVSIVLSPPVKPALWSGVVLRNPVVRPAAGAFLGLAAAAGIVAGGLLARRGR